MAESTAAPTTEAKPEPKPAELNARQVASAFFDAAVVAGKVDEARAHADPDKISVKSVEEFRRWAGSAWT